MSEKERVLLKSIERQKAARKSAETLLQDRSRQLFEANEAMQKQIEVAETQKRQVEFLKDLAADIWAADSVNSIIYKYLSSTRDFLNNALPVFVQLSHTEDNIEIEHILGVSDDTDDTGDTKSQATISEIKPTLESLNFIKILDAIDEANGTSQLFDFADVATDLIKVSQYKFSCSKLFIVPVFRFKKSIGLACYLYSDSSLLVHSKLDIVEASRTNLALAMQRQMTTANLNRKVDDLHKANLKLEQTKKQLAQSERMAAVGQLAAGVAHEINNPIGFILSNYDSLSEYADVLIRLIALVKKLPSAKTEEKIRELCEEEDISFIEEDMLALLAASRTGLKRVQEIVSGLKSFSHSTNEDLVLLNLTECIESAVQLVANEFKYEHSITTSLQSGIIVKGNQGQLQQVLVNMFVNAKQAMPNGGTVHIDLKLVHDAPIPVQITIQDEGTGIKPEHIKKLFTPFFTTKAVGVGTGLGLSISYGIIADHDGDIKVTSEIGKGTEFKILLPSCSE